MIPGYRKTLTFDVDSNGEGSFQAHYRQVILERLRLMAQERVTMQMIQNVKTHSWIDHATGSLVLSLEATLLAEKIVEERVQGTEFVPLTWWDHLKQTVVPKRLQRGWLKVRTRAIHTESILKEYVVRPEDQKVLPPGSY